MRITYSPFQINNTAFFPAVTVWKKNNYSFKITPLISYEVDPHGWSVEVAWLVFSVLIVNTKPFTDGRKDMEANLRPANSSNN
jgi:hypothetical protein